MPKSGTHLIAVDRIDWAKFMWAVHNLVGHPLMQILALFKFYDAAFWVHDVTVPKPRGAK